MAHVQQHFFRRFVDAGTGRLPANTTLHKGRYLLLETAGKGGMGAVYLARDTQRSNELVAIKEMSQGRLKDAGELQRARQRFQQEADLLGHLQHPHLPRVYDSFEDRDRSYLVMDFIRGKTLSQILKQAKGAALAVEQVMDYGLQLCDVLAYLHTHYPPVIFRDLKPSNIIVRDDGQLFLIDFGIARFWQHNLDTETFVTPGYASPEQYGGQSTPRSDIFSLGATLHHCLTGYNPQSNTQAHRCNFQAVDFFNRQVPTDLCTLVEQMVEARPEDRPVSVAEVQRRLTEIRATLIGSFRLSSYGTYDPNAVTYEVDGSSPAVVAPARRAGLLMRLPLVALGMLGSSLFGGLAPALQAARSAGVGQAVRAFPAQWWRHIVQAVENWSWDARVWTPRFVSVLLATLTLVLGGGLYLLKSAPDASHLTALALIFSLLCLLSVNLSSERLNDPLLRSIFGLMGLGLFVAGVALQALPDMVNLEQQYLPLITLNQVLSLLLLLGGIACLLRPARLFAWVDQFQLGFLAACCALLHDGFGPVETAQLPFLTPASVTYILPLLLGLLALLAMFNYTQPFGRWSRLTLFLVALAFTPLQYVFGYSELRQLLGGSAPAPAFLQQLAQANFFCVFVPPLFALLALFTRQPDPTTFTSPNERRPGARTRLTLFLLTLVVAALFNQLGQHILVPVVPGNVFPFSITILSFATLYQFIEPLLVLLTFIMLLRLRRGAQPFTWLDHTLTLSLALICALFDSAYWQAQASSNALVMDQHTANQQFTQFAGQFPAYAIYGLLLGLPLGLLALTVCHLQRQSHLSARLDAWLAGLRALFVMLERVLVLSLLAIALILQGVFGPFRAVLTHLSKAHQFPGGAAITLTLLTIGVLSALCILGCVVLARLLRSAHLGMGGVERWTVWLAALACLLLTWQDPHVGTLPLLTISIQLTGNVWNWPALLLDLVFVGGMFLAIGLAHLWLRRGFFSRYRALMQPVLLLALFCILLQFIWPIFLPLGLLILLVSVLLASQIEKVV